MTLRNASGQVSMLRVNERGDAFGPPNDHILAEVVLTLDSDNSQAFGFHLLDDQDLPVRRGYLDLLRDALAFKHTVHLDAEFPDGKTKGEVIRVWITPN